MFLFSTSENISLVYYDVRKPYFEAYIHEMPEKYKGADPPVDKIQHDKATGIPKSRPIPYTPSEMKEQWTHKNSRFQSDEQWGRVRAALDKLGFCTCHVSKLNCFE